MNYSKLNNLSFGYYSLTSVAVTIYLWIINPCIYWAVSDDYNSDGSMFLVVFFSILALGWLIYFLGEFKFIRVSKKKIIFFRFLNLGFETVPIDNITKINWSIRFWTKIGFYRVAEVFYDNGKKIKLTDMQFGNLENIIAKMNVNEDLQISKEETFDRYYKDQFWDAIITFSVLLIAVIICLNTIGLFFVNFQKHLKLNIAVSILLLFCLWSMMISFFKIKKAKERITKETEDHVLQVLHPRTYSLIENKYENLCFRIKKISRKK